MAGVDFFLCHTKQSKHWECDQFVHFQLHIALTELGYQTFFDRINLLGLTIEECVTQARGARVVIAVLDDVFPTPWCLKELEAARAAGVIIQPIWAEDKFSWEEVGKPAWSKKEPNISSETINAVFARPAIPYHRNPIYAQAAKKNMMEVLEKYVSQPTVLFNGKAKQKDDFPEVVMRMPKNAQIVAKVPNGEILSVLEVDGDGPNSQGRVRWKEAEGWVKMCNVIPIELADECPLKETDEQVCLHIAVDLPVLPDEDVDRSVLLCHMLQSMQCQLANDPRTKHSSIVIGESLLEASSAHVAMWCLLGIPLSQHHNNDIDALIRKMSSSHTRTVKLFILFAKYGARKSACWLKNKLTRCHVLWFEGDIFSVKDRRFVLSVVTSLLAAASRTDGLDLQGIDSILRTGNPLLRCGFYSASSDGCATLRLTRCSGAPVVTTTSLLGTENTNLWRRDDATRLRVCAGDLEALARLCQEVRDARSNDQWHSILITCYRPERGGQTHVTSDWQRTRAVALYACSSFLKLGSEFDFVYRFSSCSDLESCIERLSEYPQASKLIWLDLHGDHALSDSTDMMKVVIELQKIHSKYVLATCEKRVGERAPNILSRYDEFTLDDVEDSACELQENNLSVEIKLFFTGGPKLWKDDQAIERLSKLLQRASRCDQPIVGLYELDDDQIAMRLRVRNVKFLYQLRDDILSGTFDAATHNDSAFKNVTMKADRTSFAEGFVDVLMDLNQLTPHQANALKTVSLAERKHVLIEAPAGAGKSFIGLHLTDDALQRNETEQTQNTRVLFLCQRPAMVFTLVKWIFKRRMRQREMQESEVRNVVERNIHVMFDVHEGPQAIQFDIKPASDVVNLAPIQDPVQYRLVVVDEAQHLSDVFCSWIKNNLLKRGSQTRCVFLADASQSLHAEDSTIAVARLVKDIADSEKVQIQLNEVVRSTRRIVEGSNIFRCKTTQRVTSCHASRGAPMKSFLFERPDTTNYYARYAAFTCQGILHVQQTLPGFSFYNHIVILVPDAAFRDGLSGPLRSEINKMFNEKVSFVSAQEDGRTIQWKKTRSERRIVMDEVAEFDGLEKLIVLAVGLDLPIDLGSNDVVMRSQLYRALTRAHLMVVVVNELVPGGWLEFLSQVRFKDDTVLQKPVIGLAEKKMQESEKLLRQHCNYLQKLLGERGVQISPGDLRPCVAWACRDPDPDKKLQEVATLWTACMSKIRDAKFTGAHVDLSDQEKLGVISNVIRNRLHGQEDDDEVTLRIALVPFLLAKVLGRFLKADEMPGLHSEVARLITSKATSLLKQRAELDDAFQTVCKPLRSWDTIRQTIVEQFKNLPVDLPDAEMATGINHRVIVFLLDGVHPSTAISLGLMPVVLERHSRNQSNACNQFLAGLVEKGIRDGQTLGASLEQSLQECGDLNNMINAEAARRKVDLLGATLMRTHECVFSVAIKSGSRSAMECGEAVRQGVQEGFLHQQHQRSKDRILEMTIHTPSCFAEEELEFIANEVVWATTSGVDAAVVSDSVLTAATRDTLEKWETHQSMIRNNLEKHKISTEDFNRMLQDMLHIEVGLRLVREICIMREGFITPSHFPFDHAVVEAKTKAVVEAWRAKKGTIEQSVWDTSGNFVRGSSHRLQFDPYAKAAVRVDKYLAREAEMHQSCPFNAKTQQKDHYPEVVMKMPKNDQVVAKIPNGEILTVLEVDGEGPEAQGRMRWKDKEGWIKMSNVIAEAQLLPIAEAKQVDGHPEVVLKNEQGKVVAKVPNGEEVEVLQDLAENYKVRWGGYEGFAKKSNLKLRGAGHDYCEQPPLGRSVTAPVRSLSGQLGGGKRQPAPDFGVLDPDRCLDFENGFTPQRNAAHPATGDHGAVFKAKQVDGHNEVVLKDDSGKNLAKVPNGDIVEIREDPGRGDVKVGWKHFEGWARKTNIIPGHQFDQYAADSTGRYAGASTGAMDIDISTGVETAVAKQAEGHDEVVLKDDQGRNCAKVPNGDVVYILSRDAGVVRVRWKAVEGWAKAQNFLM